MNDTELFELCKSVFEKTGWESGEWYVNKYGDITTCAEGTYEWSEFPEYSEYKLHPLYTSDYPLEKLPLNTHVYTTSLGATAYVELSGETFFGDGNGRQNAPLKALLKLTIALHEAGELK